MMGKIAGAMILIALTFASPMAQTRKPDFSGHWELEKAHSVVVSPDKLQAGRILQTVVHREPKLNVTRITIDDQGEKRLDFQLETNGAKKVNKVEDHDLSFISRWQGGRLITIIRQVGAEDFGEIREQWSLSRDGNTLTIELQAPNGKDVIREKLVYARRRDG